MRILLGVLVALQFLFVLPLAGQQAVELRPGDRVRIHDAGGRYSTGVIDVVTPDSLVLRQEGPFSEGGRFRLAEVESLEISIGKHRRFLRTAAITSGIVAGAAGLLGAIAYEECVPRQFLDCLLAPSSRAESAVTGLVIGAVLGIPVGVVYGLIKGHDTWEMIEAKSASQPQLVVAGLRGRGVGLGLRIPVGR